MGKHDTNDPEYSLLWDFAIDDGELDGLDPQAVFVLGIECGRIYAQMDTMLPFDVEVHVENVTRLEALATAREWTTTVKGRDDHWATMHFEAPA